MPEPTKRSILAVDDDITVLTVIRNVLSENYEVALAKSADMATTILKTTTVDLILLDVEMPGISGFDFNEYLRNQPDYYYIPVIFVTSHGTQDIIVHAAKGGAKDFIVKPILPKILMDKVQAALRLIREPVSRQILVDKLTRLQEATMKRRGLTIEEVSDDLTKSRYNLAVDTKIAEIRQHARRLEYPEVLNMLEAMLAEFKGDDPPPPILEF